MNIDRCCGASSAIPRALGGVKGRLADARRRWRPLTQRHGVAMEVLEQHHDLEQVRALLGHARIDTTQIYTSIRPPQLKRAVTFYEDQATRMLNETRTSISVANGRARNR